MGTDLENYTGHPDLALKEIPIIDFSKTAYKVSRYDKVVDYCKHGYLICEDQKGKLTLAINNTSLLLGINNIKDTEYSIGFIRDHDFHSLLKSAFSRYNASKARYHLDFISPLSAAKNIKYSKIVFILLVCMGCIFTHATFAFHLINNILYLAQNLFKSLLFISASHSKDSRMPESEYCDDSEYPIYTILLPIYREARVAHLLIQSISKLIYPKCKLDVKIIVEDDDILTLKSLKAIDLPSYMHIIKVPYSAPRTKPKALNYAMQYARGKYIVIYDAEDRPEADQLIKAVEKFSKLPSQYSCLQAKLNYYNHDENLLTKLFSIEYSLLFDFLLKGLEAWGLPMPLGGTSNHFRSQVLRDVGAWDSYNVTEDADLGIRLYLRGYKTAVLDSYTLEESPITLGSWIKQRSRWVKGFIQTFIVYLQHQSECDIQLGFAEKAAIWSLVGLGTYAFLIFPWLIITASYLSAGFLDSLLLVNTTFALSYMYGVALTILKRDKLGLSFLSKQDIGAFLVWPLYFILHTIASYRALFELVTQPFQWNKTEHGVTKHSADLL